MMSFKILLTLYLMLGILNLIRMTYNDREFKKITDDTLDESITLWLIASLIFASLWPIQVLGEIFEGKTK